MLKLGVDCVGNRGGIGAFTRKPQSLTQRERGVWPACPHAVAAKHAGCVSNAPYRADALAIGPQCQIPPNSAGGGWRRIRMAMPPAVCRRKPVPRWHPFRIGIGPHWHRAAVTNLAGDANPPDYGRRVAIWAGLAACATFRQVPVAGPTYRLLVPLSHGVHVRPAVSPGCIHLRVVRTQIRNPRYAAHSNSVSLTFRLWSPLFRPSFTFRATQSGVRPIAFGPIAFELTRQQSSTSPPYRPPVDKALSPEVPRMTGEKPSRQSNRGRSGDRGFVRPRSMLKPNGRWTVRSLGTCFHAILTAPSNPSISPP